MCVCSVRTEGAGEGTISVGGSLPRGDDDEACTSGAVVRGIDVGGAKNGAASGFLFVVRVGVLKGNIFQQTAHVLKCIYVQSVDEDISKHFE